MRENNVIQLPFMQLLSLLFSQSFSLTRLLSLSWCSQIGPVRFEYRIAFTTTIYYTYCHCVRFECTKIPIFNIMAISSAISNSSVFVTDVFAFFLALFLFLYFVFVQFCLLKSMKGALILNFSFCIPHTQFTQSRCHPLSLSFHIDRCVGLTA